MRFKAIFTLVILSFYSLKGQDSSKGIYFLAGYGNYESANIGAGYSPNLKTSMSFSLGYQSNFSGHNQFSSTVTFERKLLTFPGQTIHLIISPKLFYWRYEDAYFVFKSLAVAPNAGIEYTPKGLPLKIYLNSGPIINYQLESIRKDFDHLGWPKKIAFNWSVGLRYNI